MNLRQLRKGGKRMTHDEILDYLKRHGFLWLYNGEPNSSRSHALLTSGKHSDGYVNVGDALKQSSSFRRKVAKALLEKLEQVDLGYYQRRYFQFVVGAATSSTDLARDVAEIYFVNHLKMKKVEDLGSKRQVLDLQNPMVFAFSILLQVEELITTSSSALQVRQGIRFAYPNIPIFFAPYLLTVVDRSDPDNRVTKVEDSIILPLIQLDIRNFEPDKCPYCQVGSVALKPKENDNWVKLTQE